MEKGMDQGNTNMPKKKSPDKTEMKSYDRSKNVNVRKASNGYVVSSYNDEGDMTYIAKSKVEVKKYINKLLKV